MLVRRGPLFRRSFALFALLLVAGLGLWVAPNIPNLGATARTPLGIADVPRQVGPFVPPVFGDNIKANSDATSFGQHEPSLAVSRANPNVVVVASKDYRDGNVKHVWIDVSTDGGITWPANRQLQMPGIPSNLPIQSDAVVMARDDGRIYVACLATDINQGGLGGVFVTWTDDNGVSWQNPSVQVYPTKNSLDDKDWFAVDNNPTSPYYHRLHVMYAPSADHIVAQYSTDGGLTWSARQTISSSGTEYTYPVIASDGTVYNFMMNNWGAGRTGTIQMTKSTNGGVSWSTPSTVASAQQPGSPIRGSDQFRFFSILSAAVDPADTDPSTRDIYVAWTDNRNLATNGTDVMYVKSSNGGTTWGAPTRLSHDPTGVVRDHITPMLSVGADSRVHAFWLDRRLDPNNHFFDSWYSSSTDGGATWDADTRVSTQSQDLNVNFPPGSGNAAGDYWGLDVSGDTVYVAWNDSRSGDQDILVSRGSLSGGATSTPTTAPPTSTATSTHTRTATSTNIPPSSTSTTIATASSTRSATTGPTITSTHGVTCPVTANGASTSCSPPSTYDYSFQFTGTCGELGTATLHFDVAPGSGGPWTLYDSQTFRVTITQGANTIQGTLNESSIPAQYSYYRVTISLAMDDGLTTNNATNATPLCTTGSATATGTVAGTSTATATATQFPACYGVWRTVPPPATGTLYSVSALALGDVWVVGPNFNLYHWDGSSWTDTPYPVPEGMGGSLVAVSGWASNDVWAAGSYLNVGGDGFPLVEHWDGSSWTIVGIFARDSSTPSGGTLNNLKAIAAIGPQEAWGVGGSSIGEPSLIRHCTPDGCTAYPQSEFQSNLLSVSGVGSNDVWAVGYLGGISLTKHWDGTKWSNVSAPNIGTLNAVDAIASNDVWASSDSGFIHWDGSQWSTVPAVSGAKSITGTSFNDVWAAGTFLLHWNGTSWDVDPHNPSSPLLSISSAGRYNVWAVGGDSQVLHYTDERYADVTPDSPFYNHINYMTCLGVMSGYQCGGEGEPCDQDNTPYFRPNSHILRGQLSKIISNAGGFFEDPGTQVFEDVPPENVFYPFIQRLTHRGVMSGYECGSVPEEPCVAPDNRPYFRPFAEATRGQISKMVANAANIQDPIPTDRQTYTDVPTDYIFWVYVERLTGRGVMSGYPCGGPGLPCDDQQRPYFLPGNNATRGQTSKIVANTFFPDCCLGH